MQSFTIFGRPGCGFCTAAVSLCERLNYKYKYVDIWAEGISKEDLAKSAGKPVQTVPQVFHGENHIGGFDDLQEYVQTLG
jgi:glutaredoxin 1